MGNVKCENVFKHVQSHVAIPTNEFASSLITQTFAYC